MVGAYAWPRFVGDAARAAVAAVAQGAVPGATLVPAGAAAGGADTASPGMANLGRVLLRLAKGAAALTAADLVAAAAALGTVTLAIRLAKNGPVRTVPVQGFGPADLGVAPVSAEVNGPANTVLLFHGPPGQPPDTAAQHTVTLRVGADGVLADKDGRGVARLGAAGQVVPLPGVDIPGLFHGPAATPPQVVPPLPGGSPIPDKQRKALDRPETLPAAPVLPSSTATPLPAQPPVPNVLPGREITPAGPQVVESHADPGLTRPTGPINGEPTGPLSKTAPNAEPNSKAQVDSENSVGHSLAAAGYRTMQNPTKGANPALTPERLQAEGLRKTADPDLLVEDRIYDTYTPENDTAKSVRDGIALKIQKRQTHRVVVDIRNTTQTGATVRSAIRAEPISGLREVIIVSKNGIGRPFRP